MSNRSLEPRGPVSVLDRNPAELDVSLIIPVYNEEESLPALILEIHAALAETGRSYEMIFVDDGSTDRSAAFLEGAAADDPALTVIRLRRNFGQTAAIQAGFDAARGEAVVALDADLQNDPADIPMMLGKLDEGFDLVAGWRKKRQDPFLNRRLPSFIANKIISLTTKVRLHDYGCTLKAMRRDVCKEVRLYGEMHRFIPAIASWMGVAIAEVPVHHRPRRFGTTKYGISRTLRVVLDLITVRFMQSYLVKPMQIFGLGGILTASAGIVLCAYLSYQKLVHGMPLADRPALMLGVLLIVVGVQLLSLGLVADVLSRTYHESQNKRPFHVRSIIRGPGRNHEI